MTSPSQHDVLTSSNKLLEELGLQNIAEDKKKELLDRIAYLIDQEVLMAVMSRLSEADIADFDQHLQQVGDDTQITESAHEFLKQRIPDLQAVVEQALVTVHDRLTETNTILST